MRDAILQAPAFISDLQEEIGNNWQRWMRWPDAFLTDAADPPMAQTPREVIWKRGKMRLYRYLKQTEAQHPLPYFIVPWLGISRPYILDMLPGQSMIEYLTGGAMTTSRQMAMLTEHVTKLADLMARMERCFESLSDRQTRMAPDADHLLQRLLGKCQSGTI